MRYSLQASINDFKVQLCDYTKNINGLHGEALEAIIEEDTIDYCKLSELLKRCYKDNDLEGVKIIESMLRMDEEILKYIIGGTNGDKD